MDRVVVGGLAGLAAGWRLFDEAVLRGAGFPARNVLALAAPEAARAADELFAAEAALEDARRHAADEVQRARQSVTPAERRPLDKLLKQIVAGAAVDDAAGLRFDELRRRHRAVVEARARAAEAFDRSAPSWREALRRAARDPLLREAVAWQNPGALKRGFEALLRQPDGASDFKTRQNEALVASYLQRYCTKNDTIGFFGPIGWARLVDAGPPLTIVPGPSLLDKRTVYFEHWAIDAMAKALAADEQLKRALPPRRSPGGRVEATTVHFPVDKHAEVPAAFARALELADGERPAQAIVETLLGDESLELTDDDEAFGVLEQLQQKKLLLWTIDIATHGPFPERRLRRALERAGVAGERGLAIVDELERLRARVAASVGDPAALVGALEALDERFRQATALEANRREGQMYAGRTLVYEDCRRHVEVRLGPAFVERLARPLALLLDSARWYTHEVARGYRAAFDEVHRQLGGGVVDFLRFRERAMAIFPAANTGTPPPIVVDAAQRLRSRWTELLALPADERRVTRASDALAPLVATAFAAPGPGWPEARFQQPDLMIAATGADAFARGEFQIVVGELHFAKASVLNFMFTKEHDQPERLFALRERLRPDGGVWPVEPAEHAVPRSDYAPLGARDLHVEIGATRSWLPRPQVLAAGELVVERQGERLRVRTRDGAHSFDVIAFFEQQLTAAACLMHFGVTPDWPHVGRVTIDDLVVSRERWVFAPEALAFAHAETPAERFAGARAWAKMHGIPRFVFVKVPEQPKPTYVDLESPIYVESLAKQARAAARLTVTEMLPSLDESWLCDAAGQRYTAELRLVAVDERTWSP